MTPPAATSALPPHVEAMLMQAARLSNSSSSIGQSHAASAGNGLTSGLLESSEAMTDVNNSPLSGSAHAHAASLPLVPLGVSSPTRSAADNDDDDEHSDAGSDLNEVDDAPKHALIQLDSEDEDDARAHSALHSRRVEPPAATSVHSPAHTTPPVENVEAADDDEEEEVDDSTYCYCQQKWSGNEMMVSCDQCLQWFHAGQPSPIPPPSQRCLRLNDQFVRSVCAESIADADFACACVVCVGLTCVCRLHGHSSGVGHGARGVQVRRMPPG